MVARCIIFLLRSLNGEYDFNFLVYLFLVINPRSTCARVTVVVLVCLLPL